MHTEVSWIFLFLEICMRWGHNSCEITSKGSGKNFSPPNSIILSCKTCLKVANLQKIKKKNVIIILILTSNDHWPHFFIITPFFNDFQKKSFLRFFHDFFEKLERTFFLWKMSLRNWCRNKFYSIKGNFQFLLSNSWFFRSLQKT